MSSFSKSIVSRVDHLLCSARDFKALEVSQNYRRTHYPLYPRDYLSFPKPAATISAQEFPPIHLQLRMVQLKVVEAKMSRHRTVPLTKQEAIAT